MAWRRGERGEKERMRKERDEKEKMKEERDQGKRVRREERGHGEKGSTGLGCGQSPPREESFCGGKGGGQGRRG